MKYWIFLILILPVYSFAITADEIVKQVDKNQVFSSRKGKAVMTIEREGKKLIKTMNVWGIKEGDKSFSEFTNPEDNGVKYLKLSNELWIYFPDADDVMKISGHMLRQGMMGSDISYEDMLSDYDFQSKYQSVLNEETNVSGVACYDVVLTAKVEDITYYKRRIFVDKEKMVAIELDLFAKSGRPLKKVIQTDIQEYSGRYFPAKIIFKDLKRENSLTTVEFKNLVFDSDVPASIFSRQNLKK